MFDSCRDWPGSRYRSTRATLPCCYMTATCKRLLRLASSASLFEGCRRVRPLPLVVFKQSNRSPQVPSTQKSCVKDAVSLPFRNGSATVVAGLLLNVLKLSACKLPECKLSRFQPNRANHSRVVCIRVGWCAAGKPHRMPTGLLDDMAC